MNIRNTIHKLKDKMETSHSLPWREDFGGYLLQRGYLLYQNLFVKRHWGFAAQLTFNTFMALIPAFAIIFAIGKGLGFEGYILSWCKYILSAQPQVYDAIVSLSESYIQYVHTRVFVIAGIAVMLWSVISLFMDIESVFNDIWGVKEDRPLQKRLIYYIAIIFCAPIVIILCSSFTIYSYLLLGDRHHCPPAADVAVFSLRLHLHSSYARARETRLVAVALSQLLHHAAPDGLYPFAGTCLKLQHHLW